MNAARATEVNSDSSRIPRRNASSRSFASALRDGLADLAYSFDGAFRPAGAMSLAERAVYGLRSLDRRLEPTTKGSPRHALPTSNTALPVTRLRAIPNIEKPADRETAGVSARRQLSTIENVWREPKVRGVSVAAFNSRARQGSVSRYRDVQIRATVGSSMVDVFVHAGGRLASVMSWTR